MASGRCGALRSMPRSDPSSAPAADMASTPTAPSNAPSQDSRSSPPDQPSEQLRLLYVLENGCTWRSLPKDFPPRSTVHGYLQLWAWDGTLERLHHALYIRTREREDREASPTAAIIDSQSIRSAEKGGRSRTR